VQSFPKHEPLTDRELDRLAEFLRACKGGKAMNIEALDGFFAALIAGPETVMPSEYYPHIFGGTMEDTCEFETLDDANAILSLMMRHWNTIAGALYGGEPYLPVLLEDDEGVAHANDWAQGFMEGVEMRRESWADVINSEEHGGSILPMMMLCHEHDPDPEMRPNPITPEQREDIITHMAAGLIQIYRYYRDQRTVGPAVREQYRRYRDQVGMLLPVRRAR